MHEDILALLPYKSSFRFVDEIISLDENSAKGNFKLKENLFFYQDHFENFPVTPGVIITEIMVQIGLVVLGIYLIKISSKNVHIHSGKQIFPLLTSSEVEFFKMVLPGEKVSVVSKKQYFRFNKLKCFIEMFDEKNELIAKGIFAGMIKESDLKKIV